jgi:hypothetical protein
MRATVGSMAGSEYGARRRIAMCTPRKITKRIATGIQKSGVMFSSSPVSTAAE